MIQKAKCIVFTYSCGTQLAKKGTLKVLYLLDYLIPLYEIVFTVVDLGFVVAVFSVEQINEALNNV